VRVLLILIFVKFAGSWEALSRGASSAYSPGSRATEEQLNLSLFFKVLTHFRAE
jgi:hypothetical protein